MFCRASCNLCTAMLCDLTALKHHGLLSVCLGYGPVPLPSLAMLLGCSPAQIHASVCICWLRVCVTCSAVALRQPEPSLNTLITVGAFNSITKTHNFSCALLCAGFYNMHTGGAALARSGASNLLDNVRASQMLAAFIVTKQRRSDCIIHFQLESCSNAHNAAANPNTLPPLTSTGSLNP